jgi:uncharacterized protein with HEPN domain
MQKDDAYLEDILEAAKSVRRFTDGISPEAFKANEEKYEAVNRKFEIIGKPRAGCRPMRGICSRKFPGGSSRPCETF